MSSRVESGRTTIVVAETRVRQTERPGAPFRSVLAGGLNALMTGAEAATSVIGGPVLAAAVRNARHEAVGQVAGPAGGDGGAAPAGAVSPELAAMHAMQRESQAFNLQLLALQEEVQQENRRFSTLSNVLRARHDTAKAAVANIRS